MSNAFSIATLKTNEESQLDQPGSASQLILMWHCHTKHLCQRCVSKTTLPFAKWKGWTLSILKYFSCNRNSQQSKNRFRNMQRVGCFKIATSSTSPRDACEQHFLNLCARVEKCHGKTSFTRMWYVFLKQCVLHATWNKWQTTKLRQPSYLNPLRHTKSIKRKKSSKMALPIRVQWHHSHSHNIEPGTLAH